jgi:hypothetical protein
MASDRRDSEERQARVDAMIEEFRAAQRRRLASRHRPKQEAVDSDQPEMSGFRPPPADKDQ